MSSLSESNATSAPLVSCIMPTRNRRRFVSQSILYFLRQDYPNKELIILDDGEDSVADLVPDDERIRYVRLDEPLLVGAKRNLGCRLSRGDFVAHWDDDDWMAAHRLSTQVSGLLQSGADICGVRELLHYHLDAGEAWLYCYPTDERAWLAGGTLLYRRSAWEAHPFLEINVGEDNAFVFEHPPERLHALPDSSFYVALIHAGNTSAKRLTDKRWQSRPLNHVSRLIDSDREFYATLRNGHAPQRTRHQTVNTLAQQTCDHRPQNPSRALAINFETADNLPLVSCIMPTHNRRAFIPQAIEYFKRQDYPHKELIVVDDGDDGVSDLIPQDADIHYLHLPRKCSIGAKRNCACEIARGEIVILWDDDDWYAQNRISYQVAPLLAGVADITGFDNSLLYDLPRGEFWSCTSQLHARMFYQGIVGGTLAFRKILWNEQIRFPDISEREDAVLLETMMSRGARLEKLTNDGVFVYIRHDANTWQFTLGSFLDSGGWQKVAPPPFLPEQDRKFYGVAGQSTRVSENHAESETDSSGQPAVELPLVSCILATGNRMPFLKQALKYFLNQTYENKELIVVDDGLESSAALIPADERIKYVRLDNYVHLGSKLNIGIEKSSGAIIQKLDDDDYYHPRFLETTVNALVGHDPLKTVVAFDCFLILIAATGELKFSGRGWSAGQTLCFYRQLWEQTPFRDTPRAEDWFFLEDNNPQQIKIEDPELFIAVRHQAGHLWTNLGTLDVTEYFTQHPNFSKSLAECVSAEDLAFYEALREGFPQSEAESSVQSKASVHPTADSLTTTLNIAT